MSFKPSHRIIASFLCCVYDETIMMIPISIQQVITTVFRSWWFDPLSASLSFFISVIVYTHYEIKEGKSRFNNIFEFVFGKQDKDEQNRVKNKGKVGDKGQGKGERESKNMDKEDDARRSCLMSFIAYWIGILVWVHVVPPPTDVTDKSNTNDERGIPDGIPTSLNSLAYVSIEIASGIVLYDTIFFFIHLVMHEFRFVAAWTQHYEHHKPMKHLEAYHVLHHSLPDGILQVIVNIIVQRFTLWGNVKTRFARMMHNILVTMMLTESHSASSYPNFFKWWCVGVREHRNHHLNKYRGKGKDLVGRGNSHHNYPFHHRYQQFFGHWDALRHWHLSQKVSEKDV